jgi:hypothetical protein
MPLRMANQKVALSPIGRRESEKNVDNDAVNTTIGRICYIDHFRPGERTLTRLANVVYRWACNRTIFFLPPIGLHPTVRSVFEKWGVWAHIRPSESETVGVRRAPLAH